MRWRAGAEGAFAPAYEVDSGAMPGPTAYASYPGGQSDSASYQQPPFATPPNKSKDLDLTLALFQLHLTLQYITSFFLLGTGPHDYSSPNYWTELRSGEDRTRSAPSLVVNSQTIAKAEECTHSVELFLLWPSLPFINVILSFTIILRTQFSFSVCQCQCVIEITNY